MKLTSTPFVLLLLICLSSCEREDPRPNAPNSLGNFTVTVSNRQATTANLNWTVSTNPNNNDSVKYRIVLNGNQIVDNLFSTSYALSGLIADSTYLGNVYAYTQSGDTASAPFVISNFNIPPPAYSYVTGFYRVTETTTTFSTGTYISDYTFVGKATLINDSTIQFEQNRRVPRTWWTTDFPTVIYPSLNDSLMGMGTSPKGRILNTSTIRMGYLFGTSTVYDVKQIWTKLDNPADTSTIVYVYPSVPSMVNTVAGSNYSGNGSGTSGNGGLATQAAVLSPVDVVSDGNGNVYFCEGQSSNGYSIRKVDPNGIITRYVGNGVTGYSGDGGPATSAQVDLIQGVALDASGNMYISDAGNRVIRKVSTGGIITTIAGTPGVFGFSGDGGPATSAVLALPQGICVDASGNIFFADNARHVVRKISTTGIITTVAGIGNSSGYSGDGGLATAAKLMGPTDVCVDAAGNLYIADKGNHCIRKVTPTGNISTIAGIGGTLNSGFSGDGGTATTAKLNSPHSVTLDQSGNLYISDFSNDRIRKIDAAGIITTIGGNGTSTKWGDGPDFFNGDYGAAMDASIPKPYGIHFINNVLYLTTWHRIRKITF